MNQHQTLAIQALEQMRGDDFPRARLAFSGLTSAQMEGEHRQSGKTRRQLLNEYEQHDSKITAAIEWIRTKS